MSGKEKGGDKRFWDGTEAGKIGSEMERERMSHSKLDERLLMYILYW